MRRGCGGEGGHPRGDGEKRKKRERVIESTRISFTMKRDFTDRCTYVNQHTNDAKGTGIIYIMIRHFGITTKRGAAMSACAVEFYIWDTSCHIARLGDGGFKRKIEAFLQ